MADWKTPIYDRTQADVDHAMQKIAEWIVADITSASSVGQELKGCLNVSDINRIEGNIEYLSEQLKQYGYSPNTSVKSWSETGLPNEKDITRIINNVKSLIESFYRHPNAPSLPDEMLHYSGVNAVEENISLIKVIIDEMASSFKKSGAFQSGSTMRLPVRR